MIGDIDNENTEDPIDESSPDVEATEEISEGNIDLSADDDVSDGSTAEIKVDELVAKLDSLDSEETAHQREIRLKLEALQEQQDDEFGSTYNFNIDEDL